MELNKVYNENCLETMSRMKNKSVDITITSPPYNMNLRISNGKYISRQIIKEMSSKYEGFNDNQPIDEFYETHKTILKEILRVSKITFYNIQLVTGSKRAFFKLIGEFSEELKEIIIWDKVNCQPAMQPDVLNSQFEFILVFGDNAISRKFTKSFFERGTLSNLWQIKRGGGKLKNHGAVFPAELVVKILDNFSEINDIVYDPFAGSGTVPKVAYIKKRYYIASELLSNYYQLINKNILKIGLNF